MGGGRTAEGIALYKRVDGKYVRQVPYKNQPQIAIREKAELGQSFSKELKKVKSKKEFLDLVETRFGKNSVSPDFVNKNDLEMIKKVVGTVADLEEKYPFMKGFIKFTSTISGSSRNIAEMSSNGVLDINSSVWSINKNPILYNRYIHPANNTPESTIAHEFGHAIHSYLYKKMQEYYYKNKDMDNYYSVLASINSGAILRKFEEKAYKKIGLNKNTGRAQISKFAEMADMVGAKASHEAFAEAFADVFSNKTKASDASKAFVNEVVKEAKKWDKK